MGNQMFFETMIGKTTQYLFNYVHVIYIYSTFFQLPVALLSFLHVGTVSQYLPLGVYTVYFYAKYKYMFATSYNSGYGYSMVCFLLQLSCLLVSLLMKLFGLSILLPMFIRYTLIVENILCLLTVLFMIIAVKC